MPITTAPPLKAAACAAALALVTLLVACGDVTTSTNYNHFRRVPPEGLRQGVSQPPAPTDTGSHAASDAHATDHSAQHNTPHTDSHGSHDAHE